MKRSIALLAMGTVMAAGCATISTPDARLATACSSYAHTLYALAAEKPAMSAAQVATVNDVRSIVNPICLDHNYDSTANALDAVTNQLARLSGIEVDDGR